MEHSNTLGVFSSDLINVTEINYSDVIVGLVSLADNCMDLNSASHNLYTPLMFLNLQYLIRLFLKFSFECLKVAYHDGRI